VRKTDEKRIPSCGRKPYGRDYLEVLNLDGDNIKMDLINGAGRCELDLYLSG
jgi:hypothetical protein